MPRYGRRYSHRRTRDGFRPATTWDENWFNENDLRDARKIAQIGFDTWLKNENKGSSSNVIVFPRKSCAIIWVKEITGQMSDGWWENSQLSRTNAWELWSSAKIEIHPGQAYTTVYVPAYGVTILAREPALANRMISYVRESLELRNYDVSDLKKDLRVILWAMRHEKDEATGWKK